MAFSQCDCVNRITSLAQEASGTGFQWQTAHDTHYRLEGTGNLLSDKRTIRIERLKGTGDLCQFLDPATPGQEHYTIYTVEWPEWAANANGVASSSPARRRQGIGRLVGGRVVARHEPPWKLDPPMRANPERVASLRAAHAGG